MVWVPIQMVGSALGGWVSFECHTEAQPKAISYWARDYGSESELVLMPNARIKPEITSNGYRTHMKLTIQQLQHQDLGNYRCVAKNSLGEAEGSVKLIGTSFYTSFVSISTSTNSYFTTFYFNLMQPNQISLQLHRLYAIT